MYQFKGVLKVKGSVQAVSEKFSKREFVVSDNAEKYPQLVSFELTKDKCLLIDQFNEGDKLTVSFNLKGREWKNPQGVVKYFNSLEAWKIEGEAPTTTASPAPVYSSNTKDLPF